MITVRHPRFDLSALPQDWLAGSRAATWFGNAGHVFIPVGEEFFIDTVRHFRDEVADPALRADVRAFIGQESVHRRAHEQLWGLLRDRGVPVDAYAAVVRRVRAVERVVPPALRLSVTAALEHYTAAFGVAFLTEDLSDAVPPEMARLLAWHGAEELEHRAVAFDVLQLVDDRYVVRAAGFAVASALLVVVPAAGVAMFGLADLRRNRPAGGRAHLGPATASRRELAGMSARFLRSIGGHAMGYLRPGFHPDDLALPAGLDLEGVGV